MTILSKKVVLLLSLVLGSMFLTGCGKRELTADGTAPADAGKVFRILAGSELKDLADEIKQFGQSKGIKVQLEYSGSLDAVDKLSEAHKYDAVWLSHGKYLQLVPAVRDQIKASEKTMYSRVVLGVKPKKAAELGWNLTNESGVSWKEVVGAVKAGKLKLAMTNPAGSNTGFVTLVGVASELSGKGDALEEADIPAEKLKELFSGISLTSGSSGDLLDKFKADPTKADAIVNYEASVRTLISQGMDLAVMIPKEGVITADYPLMLLKSSTQQVFFDELVAYLRDPVTQKMIADKTLRTPLAGDGSGRVVNELPFPASLKVVDALLSGFMNEYSKPSSSYFALDVSGSMEGPRMNSMKQAMTSLASSDGSVGGRFSSFRSRERVLITPFSATVYPESTFELGQSAQSNKVVLDSISAQVATLSAKDGTAIYDALLSIYDKAQAELRTEKRNVSIVLLTDGENNTGANLDTFLAHVKARGAPVVPVFAILYGEGSAKEIGQLAGQTNGRVFDARSTSLKAVLKAIRSYQ